MNGVIHVGVKCVGRTGLESMFHLGGGGRGVIPGGAGGATAPPTFGQQHFFRVFTQH